MLAEAARKRRWRLLRLGALVALLAVIPVPTAASQPSAPSPLPHIVVIIEENHEFDRIIGNSNAPYINSLATAYALATNYDAVSHPSLRDYLALVAGRTWGLTDDHNVDLPNSSLANELDAAGLSWGGYMQSMPGDAVPPCHFHDDGLYVRRHNPFAQFSYVIDAPGRCRQIRPFSAFSPAALPQFTWITPNMCKDMHDCSIKTGDRWLANHVPGILSNMTGNDVLFLTWDEGMTNIGGGGHVVTIAAGPGAKAAFTDATRYNHFSLLRTVEDGLGLPCQRNDCSARSMANMLDWLTPSGS